MSSTAVQFWHPRYYLEIVQADILENPWPVRAMGTKQHRSFFKHFFHAFGWCFWDVPDLRKKLVFCHSLISGCQSIFGSSACYSKKVTGKQSLCQPLPAGHSLEDKELEGSMAGVNPIRASSKTLKCWKFNICSEQELSTWKTLICHRLQGWKGLWWSFSLTSSLQTVRYHFASSS